MAQIPLTFLDPVTKIRKKSDECLINSTRNPETSKINWRKPFSVDVGLLFGPDNWIASEPSPNKHINKELSQWQKPF